VEELKKLVEEEKRETETFIKKAYELLKENKGYAFTLREILKKIGREDLMPKSIAEADLLYMVFESLRKRFPSIKKITYKDQRYYYFEEER